MTPRRAVTAVAAAFLLGGADAARVLLGRLLRRAAPDRGDRRLGAGARARSRRSGAAAADRAGRARARRARRDRGLERDLAHLGAARRAGGRERRSGSCCTPARCSLAVGALRTRAALRAVEPALAAGATLVIGYGLAGRLLPGIVELARSASAGGRLEQPITYWNAEGALAAIGLVLCARLAGDVRRPRGCARVARGGARRRSAPACTCPTRAARSRSPCSGWWCSSRPAPSRAQLRAAVARAGDRRRRGGLRRCFPGVASLEGDVTATRDGAIALALLVAARGSRRADRCPRRPRREPDDPLPWARRLGPVVAVGIAGVARRARARRARRAAERRGARGRRGRDAARRRSSSNRYEYWRVGLRRVRARAADGPGLGRLPRRMAARAVDPRGGARRALDRARDGRRARASSACSRSPSWSPASPPRRAARSAAIPRRPPALVRGAARLAPARVDRLGLAAARGDAAGDRARRRARRAQRGGRALSGSSRRSAARARSAAAGSRPLRERGSTAPRRQVVRLAPDARPRAAATRLVAAAAGAVERTRG